MAINNKVIIQHRRGALSDFDPRKMSPGELAVTTDARDIEIPEPNYESEETEVPEPDYESELINDRLSIINQMEVVS